MTGSSGGMVSLPILAECDVAVLGGGFGGIAAAFEFAQAGHRVMLIEPRTYLGREITATLRPWLNAPSDPPPLIASVQRAAGSGPALNMDALKIHLEDLLLEAGVRLLYASVAVGIQQTGGALQGVVIGNKSGRQAVRCRLLVDTTETALVARLLGEQFEPAPPDMLEYRRTLEYDQVGSDLPLDQPLWMAGQYATLHTGCRGDDHVLVECALRLPFSTEGLLDTSERESLAREQTMAFAAALAREVPAFQSAYLSGTSYELCGSHTTRLRTPRAAAMPSVPDVTLDWPGMEPPLNLLAGAIRGVWYLNEAVPLASAASFDFCNPVFCSEAGAALARTLCAHWLSVAAPQRVLKEPAAPILNSQLQLREPFSPQRGRPYPRTVFTSESWPVLREEDVLVVGGGSSGAIASITAAREGVRTLLIEMNPGLGGTGTFGGVHSYWFGRRTGFSAQVMKLVEDMHEALQHSSPQGIIPKWNIEAKSHALLMAAREAGVEILFNAFVIGALVEDGSVCGVSVATRMGVVQVRARVVIDATGDGDVAAFAGAEYVYGHARDHVVMWYALAQFTRPGLTRNHFTSMVDVSNIEDYTRAILAGRRRGGKGEMHDHGIYVAPRESRHIQGEVVLTLTDQLRQRRWHDVVNVAFSNHDVKGQSGSDWLRIGLIPPNLDVEIPYRALLPRGLEGILVVGKALSATHDALPAIRMQADLENLGGVAALAAAQAVRTGTSLRALDLRSLQLRLVEEGVLPSEVLTRELHRADYTDAELCQMIEALPVFPLHQYSDMELTELFTDVIPLVEICCAGPRIVPLLEAAHDQAEGDRRVLLAQLLALVGSSAGVDTLINAIDAQLQGAQLPERTTHIRYTQLPPDHGAMPEVVYLLYSLGMVPDARAQPIWQRVVELLAGVGEADFYADRKGIFYYVDAVGYGAERAGTAGLIPLLQQLHHYAPFYQQMAPAGFQPDFVQERRAYLELVIGRALARCGSVDGLLVLASYLNDSRALLAEHAHSELRSITGEDYGKDVREWSRWIEMNGDALPSRPWRPPTEPVQAWGEVVDR